jgi:hypothetical protein
MRWIPPNVLARADSTHCLELGASLTLTPSWSITLEFSYSDVTLTYPSESNLILL